VVEVEDGSEADTKGILAGDLITEAGQQKITGIADFEARVEEAQEAGRKSLLLLVRRDGAPRFVALGLK
jgi:serine protease Do